MWFHTCGAGISNDSQEHELLIKFIVMLATSEETNLGFDKNIVRIGDESDFDLGFAIQGISYHTSRLLYDLGADAATGRGTRAFEVVDQKSKEVRVIKDCWIEDRPGKQLEHDIVADIKGDIAAGTERDTATGVEDGTGNDEGFHKYFIDVCGYRKTDEFGGFDKISQSLKTGTFIKDAFEPELLIPIAEAPRVYLHSANNSTANQHPK